MQVIKNKVKDQFFKENSYYRSLIQNFYGGSTGCFCAFMQFFYQYNQSAIFAPELKPCFEKLYLSELGNCQILCEILLKLGGDNKYCSSAQKFVSGCGVDYDKDFKKAYLCDIELLELGIIEVKGLILKIETPLIKQRLKEILSEKTAEIKILKESFLKMA